MKIRIVLVLLLAVFLCGCGKTPGVTAPTETTGAVTTEVPTTAETTVETTQAMPVALEFGYAGEYLTCLNAESMLGIDVSSFQKEIDWAKVADAGIQFVMIRVGFRGYGEKGSLIEDKYAQANYAGAKKAGLKVGGYFFSQATSEEEAIEEAEYVLELTKDWQMDMPFGFDWECHTEEYRTWDVDVQTLTACTKAFCQAMAEKGQDALIYVNPVDSPKQLHWEELTQYGLWLGQYGETLDEPQQVSMWQYTRQGEVFGIDGYVDLNLSFIDYSAR